MEVLNRDVIKYFAMFTMLLNHIATVFLVPGTLIYEFCLNIGYFTAVTMCYFLVEGYEYTRSKKAYARRLLFFACISQIPYDMAFSKGKPIEFSGYFNMMFSLFLCFMLILIMDQVKVQSLRNVGIASIVLLSLICDWQFLAPVFTLMFIWAKDSKQKKLRAYLAASLLFGGIFFLSGIIGNVPVGMNLIHTLLSMSGVGLSGLVILYFYNGRRMERGRTFSKWFCYLFYPVHLLVIGIIRNCQ